MTDKEELKELDVFDLQKKTLKRDSWETYNAKICKMTVILSRAGKNKWQAL